jgi:thiosulfate reductase cytochrome b subunit
MKESTKRASVRWIHIILAVPIIGYIYSPFDLVHFYAPITRYVFVPIIVISGLWMWKGHLVRRLFAKAPAQSSRVPV